MGGSNKGAVTAFFVVANVLLIAASILIKNLGSVWGCLFVLFSIWCVCVTLAEAGVYPGVGLAWFLTGIVTLLRLQAITYSRL